MTDIRKIQRALKQLRIGVRADLIELKIKIGLIVAAENDSRPPWRRPLGAVRQFWPF